MSTLIFDIGKTNKKAFVFNKNYQELYKSFSRFEENQDEDGFPCDDLEAIQNWMQETIQGVLQKEKHPVQAINFSTYGASFVHLDKNGKPLTPLYNYLKPIPDGILQSFRQKYGDPLKIARQTASPPLGMLNSGLQLYWLKHTRPELFQQIRWSLHLPQYLSFLSTGIPLSEYTSIGCHTALWDFAKKDYHQWVYAEGIDRVLAPIVNTGTSINRKVFGKQLKIGVGIHDSSAALLPYLRADKKPFLLISTGTWSISINPFNIELLTDAELKEDCLNFLRINGEAVKASRLFLGQEYKVQIQQLNAYYNKDRAAHKQLRFDQRIHAKLCTDRQYYFAFENLQTPWKQPEKSRLQELQNFEEAHHQLMLELVELQIAKTKLAIGNTPICKIYIDGGFAENETYVQLIARHFKDLKLRTTQSPLGSALGAAIAISEKDIKKKFLKNNYALKKHQ